VLFQEPVSVGLPEQHYLHAADRRDRYCINDQRQRILEVPAEQRRRERQESDKCEVQKIERDERRIDAGQQREEAVVGKPVAADYSEADEKADVGAQLSSSASASSRTLSVSGMVGTSMPTTSSVSAIAYRPSLSATTRPNSTPSRSKCLEGLTLEVVHHSKLQWIGPFEVVLKFGGAVFFLEVNRHITSAKDLSKLPGGLLGLPCRWKCIWPSEPM
jgi:hypothetical protein